jgi:hypothetical protein
MQVSAWSLDNGFCPCSYHCSLILSYFHNFVIYSEPNCSLFLADINAINNYDTSGVICLVTVSQAGKFFFPAVFPTIVCCWLGTEPRIPAWRISFTLGSGHQNEEYELCLQCCGHSMLSWEVKAWGCFPLQLLSENDLILQRTERGMITNVHRSSCKVPLLSDRNETWIFSTDFQKNTQISNFTKICPMGAELFHADWRTDGRTDRQIDIRTDMTKLTVAFRNFAKVPCNWSTLPSPPSDAHIRPSLQLLIAFIKTAVLFLIMRIVTVCNKARSMRHSLRVTWVLPRKLA